MCIVYLFAQRQHQFRPPIDFSALKYECTHRRVFACVQANGYESARCGQGRPTGHAADVFNGVRHNKWGLSYMVFNLIKICLHSSDLLMSFLFPFMTFTREKTTYDALNRKREIYGFKSLFLSLISLKTQTGRKVRQICYDFKSKKKRSHFAFGWKNYKFKSQFV